MVGGMLTLASLSAHTEKLTLDFTALLNGSAEMLRLNLAKRGNTLNVNVESSLWLFGNADLLAQVLSNLLTNAGAHTENGDISLTAKRNGGEITIMVKDNGTGISPEFLPRVFERGVSDGGTGIGLYLCKNVVESHGGRIWLESEPGAGTAAFITFPVYEGQFGGEAE
jgi:signal transduction histidine kinase